MTKFFNYLWRVWFVLLASVMFFVFAVPVVLLSFSPKHFRYAYIFIRWWCVILFYAMGFRYELIRETEKILDKNSNYIFIANHTSVMDIMLMCVLHQHHPICFIGKAELGKIPIFGMVYKRICISVDRQSAKSRANVYLQAAEKIRNGQSLVIFPEGGVPDDTSIMLDAFRDGAFSMSEAHQFPIVVYTFAGLKEMFPFDNSKGYAGRVKVFMNDIMSPEAKETMKMKSHNMIKNSLEKYYHSIKK